MEILNVNNCETNFINKSILICDSIREEVSITKNKGQQKWNKTVLSLMRNQKN